MPAMLEDPPPQAQKEARQELCSSNIGKGVSEGCVRDSRSDELTASHVWLSVAWARPLQTGRKDDSIALEAYEVEQTSLAHKDSSQNSNRDDICAQDNTLFETVGDRRAHDPNQESAKGNEITLRARKGCRFQWRVRAVNAAGLPAAIYVSHTWHEFVFDS
jgi:hypothetical protein